MQDLTLVGVLEDGEHLELTDAAGQRFRVRIDESLRAAVRRDLPRLAQLQVETEGLRPREIQARIRAGQTAEEIADAAGVPVEHVRRFEGPVLAEREFVAGQARGVRLRRAGGGMTPFTLGELVQQRLSQRQVDDAEATWDAWREDGGTWVVCLSFHAGSSRRRAHWTYDMQLRHVAARDDEARWFTEEERSDATGQRRLTPIREPRPGARDAMRGSEVHAAGRDQPYDLAAEDSGRAGDRYGEVPPGEERYAEARQAARYGEARQDTRYGEARRPELRYLEEYPDEHFHPDRYENARYGEDHVRGDPYHEEIYGEDRPDQVRRATVDLLDTLRERRGRRQHLAPADPVTSGSDAVDVAVETLRARADAFAEGPAAPTTRSRPEPGEPDLVRLPDEVIELPDDPEPVRPRPAPAGVAASPPGAGPYPEPTPRPGGRAIGTGHPAGGSKRPAREAPAPRGGGRAAGARTGSRGPAGAPADPGATVAPAASRPSARPGTGSPAAAPTARAASTAPGNGPGRKAPVGYPSPPAPPAPQRERDPSGPASAHGQPGGSGGQPADSGQPGGNGQPQAAAPGQTGQTAPATERTSPPSRRNKRASVPSWDDIVFGSRRE